MLASIILTRVNSMFASASLDLFLHVICICVYVCNTFLHFLNFCKEEEVSTKSELLAQSETLRRRLHEQVTELQGQLAIEEQRSRFCAML